MYINANVNLDPNDYIGGKLYSFEDGEPPIDRVSEIYNYIYKYSDSYLVCNPDTPLGHQRYNLIYPVEFSDLRKIFNSLPIRRGIDLIDHQTYLEIVAYGNSHKESVYLYPLSDDKVDEICDISSASMNDLDTDINFMLIRDGQKLGTTDEHYIIQSWG